MTLTQWATSQPGRCAGCGHHVATQGCRCGGEWDVFVSALRAAADATGLISQTRVRPLIQAIPHKHRGQLYKRARRDGVIELVAKEPSTDEVGGNTDKDQKVYRLKAAA